MPDRRVESPPADVDQVELFRVGELAKECGAQLSVARDRLLVFVARPGLQEDVPDVLRDPACHGGREAAVGIILIMMVVAGVRVSVVAMATHNVHSATHTLGVSAQA